MQIRDRRRDQRQHPHTSDRHPPDPTVRPPDHRDPPSTSSPQTGDMYATGDSPLGHRPSLCRSEPKEQDHRGSVLLANYFSAILAALRLAAPAGYLFAFAFLCTMGSTARRWAPRRNEIRQIRVINVHPAVPQRTTRWPLPRTWTARAPRQSHGDHETLE